MRKLKKLLNPLKDWGLQKAAQSLKSTIFLSTELLSLALTTTAIVGVPQIFTPVTIAQTIPGQQPFAWWDIFQNEPPVEKRPGGKRGDLCAIAPRSINTETEVWNDRPLFVWQGNFGKIEVQSNDRKQVLWSQPVAATDSLVRYTGAPLLPSQIYNWVIFDLDNNPIFFVPFKVMDAQKRDRIRLDLMALEEELKNKKATAEQIALKRANYFAQHQLWSDVLQEVYTVKNPSATLKEILQKIPTQLCQ